MPIPYTTLTLMLVALTLAAMSQSASAQHRPFRSVPPTLEIEVLDPGEHSNGIPAVKLENGTVEIPPVVLVHRYYYSGDRSFQGPLLPGGPSILVLNHPKSGEQLYVPAQMMPGAPEVTYTKSGITYQYESNSIMLRFGITGKPVIKYQSGLSAKQKISKILRLEAASEKLEQAKVQAGNFAGRIKSSTLGLAAATTDAAKIITLPVSHISQVLPFGKILFSGELEETLTQRAAIFKRDLENKRAQRRARIDNLTIPTNR